MLLLHLLACAEVPEEAADPCAAGREPTLTIGTGETAFEAVSSGDGLELVHGPQGGYHTYIGLAATFLDPSATWLTVITGTLSGEVLAQSDPLLTMRCNGAAGQLQSWGTLLIWDAQPADLDDQPITVAAEITDAAGTTVSTTIELAIDDPTI